MTPSGSRSLSAFFLLMLAGLFLAPSSRAQTLTNQAALQRSSQARAAQEADLHRMVLLLARQKGWPLTLRNKKGVLAYLRGVNGKGLPVYITTTDNILSAATIRTNQLWAGGSTGLNLSGSSPNLTGKMALWDEGRVRSTHVELNGRVTQTDNSSVLSDHSTHVAGTLIAAGVNPLAKGMSYGAQKLLAYDFDNDVSEMMGAAANLLVSNHSYATIAGWYFDGDKSRWEFFGDPGDTVDIRFGLYDAETQLWDSIAYNAPQYLIVKAAGNNRGETGPAVGSPYYRMDNNGNFINAGPRPASLSSNNGYNTIATYGNAKNILTVGAVGPIPGGYTQPSDVVMTEFSSQGPTGDGRIKPDVVADGLNVLSSFSSADNAYDILSGTSMASPAAAGSAFLLQEYYAKRHGGLFMRAATLKGLLIHTADEAGANPGPDYQFGWGLINMQKAAAVITADPDDQFILEENLVNASHDADTFRVVASGTTPLIATISWTDPPAVPAPIAGNNFADVSPKLINDLDLRITDSVTHALAQPWVLNPNDRPAAATTGDNKLDNVEKVVIATPIPGRTYQIKVSHKGTLARGSQAYTLLVSGAGGQVYCPSVSTNPGASIDKVVLSNFSNTNAAVCRNYADLTGLAAAPLPLGQTQPISITHSSCNGSNNPRVLTVYIDFNNNGSFSDAGEMVAQSGVVTGGLYTGNITIPVTAVVGSYSRMRIIAEETGAPSSVTPCGSYAAGETEDYRVLFTTPANDVGVTALEYPTLTTCANDSQLVALHIRNFGTTPQTSVPVTTVIKNGAAVVAVLTAVCKDSIAPRGEVIFTYNRSFPSIPGTTYTFTSSTGLATDLNTSNDENLSTITVNAGAAALPGTATLCTATGKQVVLKAASTGNDLPLWYESPTAATPIAAGANTTTTVVPSDKTYYLGPNDLKAKAGLPNKMASSNGAGAYFRFGGNFLKFTTSVPLTIESAKMYIGHSGQISLTLATLVSYTSQGYSFIPLYSTTVHVYATTAHPDTSRQVNVAAGDNTDTGAVYYLNIPVPTPGDYIILIDCLNYASAFVNISSTNLPYPMSLPGVFAVTGNDFRDDPKADSLTFFKKFYFPFYNIGLRLAGCPGPRVPVVATTPPAPVITLSGNLLSSNVVSGNQWYRNGTAIPGATEQTDTATLPGIYQSIIADAVTGCNLPSNAIHYTGNGPVDAIGLSIYPNPGNGIFQLEFFLDTPATTSVSLINTLGQKVYEATYPDFSGQFSRQIGSGSLASGMYVLKIVHGDNTYIRKILVKK
ncbi:MAG TPA: S8 family serine peptidase [Puia sp.]|nr:S8 family serine peptidase [Puia sp.]